MTLLSRSSLVAEKHYKDKHIIVQAPSLLFAVKAFNLHLFCEWHPSFTDRRTCSAGPHENISDHVSAQFYTLRDIRKSEPTTLVACFMHLPE